MERGMLRSELEAKGFDELRRYIEAHECVIVLADHVDRDLGDEAVYVHVEHLELWGLSFDREKKAWRLEIECCEDDEDFCIYESEDEANDQLKEDCKFFFENTHGALIGWNITQEKYEELVAEFKKELSEPAGI